MALDPVTAVVDLVNGIGGKLVDRLFPDKIGQAAERSRAEFELTQLTFDSDIKLYQTQLSAIIAEAQSADPWTSRARPSFLYVIYVMILVSLPMGLLSAYSPDIAARISNGMKMWLAAIPDPLWALFGAGYLGYVTAKSYDNTKKLQAAS